MSDELRLSVEKLVYGGDGLAHADGNTVFVPYVFPGEEVRAATKSKRKKLIWAELLEITSPAKERGKAKCAHFQKCGGCHYRVGRRDCRAFSGTLWLSKSCAVGGAKRDATGARIFPAGKFRDRANR